MAAGAIAVGSTVVGETLIGPDTHVPISVVVAVVSIGITAAFTIARLITRWEDRLDAFERRVNDLPCFKDDGHECHPKPKPTGETRRWKNPSP